MNSEIQHVKNHLIMRSVRYAIEHDEFNPDEMYRDLGLTKEESRYVDKLFHYGLDPGPNALFQRIKSHETEAVGEDIVVKGPVYRILPGALFSYLDSLELEQAMRSSTRATWFAGCALAVSLVVGIEQIFPSFWRGLAGLP